LCEISDPVRSREWLLDCFVYISSVNRLDYLVGGVTYTLTLFDKVNYLLGFISEDSGYLPVRQECQCVVVSIVCGSR
jgi:hypothetical protein